MGKMHLTIIASALALLVGCAETAYFKDAKTEQIFCCKPICRDPTAVPLWVVVLAQHSLSGCDAHTNDTCIAAYTEAGYVRLTGDAADECRSHATDPDGNLVSTRFSDCMNDMVRRRR